MRHHILATVALCTAFVGTQAQTEYNLKVTETDGTTSVFSTDNIYGMICTEGPVYTDAPVMLRASYGTSHGMGLYTVEFGTEAPDEAGDPSRMGGLQASLVLCAPVSTDRYDAQLPEGYYRPAMEMESMTFNLEKSAIFQRIEEGPDGVLSNFLIDGTVDVRRNGTDYDIRIEVTAITGVNYEMRYCGPIKFGLSSNEFEPFDHDVNIDFEGCQARYYGNWTYPLADDLTIQLYAGEFNDDHQMTSGYWLQIDGYMPKVESPMGKDITIADGTYLADTRAFDEVPFKTNTPYTFGRGMMMDMWGVETMVGTWITYNSPDGRRMGGLVTGGDFTVAANGTDMAFNFVLDNGYTLTGTYKGNPLVVNFYDQDPPERPYSTLEGDRSLNLVTPVLCLAYEEDITFVPGLTTWYMFLCNEDMEEGDMLQLYPLTTGDVFEDGVYEVNGSLQSMTIIPGNVDYGGGILFSWYGDLDSTDAEGYQTVLAPISGGKMTVTTTQGSERRVEIDFTDDAGHRITGTWTGTVEVLTQSMINAPQRHKAPLRRVR